MSLGFQLGSNGAMVLDDAVVHDRDARSAVEVRMGVHFGGPSVRRPPRVRDAQTAVRPLRRDEALERRDLPEALANLEPVSVHRREPGRVVAAVLETLQCRREERHRLIGADITDDPHMQIAPQCPATSSAPIVRLPVRLLPRQNRRYGFTGQRPNRLRHDEAHEHHVSLHVRVLGGQPLADGRRSVD